MSEAPMRLHWSPDSANLVVRVALEELGLDYQAVRVDRARQQQRSPEYLKLNPQGLIPVLEDGPVVLFETGAILVYLTEKTGRLGPEGPDLDDREARAAFLKWLFWISNTLHSDLRAIFYTERYVPAQAVADARRGFGNRVRGHTELIERELAKTGWLGATGPTLADLYLAICLRWGQLYPSSDDPCLRTFSPGPIKTLLHTLEARPGIRRAMEAEAISQPAFTAPHPPDIPPSEITG